MERTRALGVFVASGIVALLAGAASGAGVAFAGDVKPMEQAIADEAKMETLVAEHIKTKALEALKSDVDDIMKAREGLDPKLVDKYDTLLGRIIKGTTDDGVQRVVIKAMGSTKDPKFFLYVQPHLAQPDKRSATPLLADAIEATGAMAADNGVGALIQIVKESKDYTIGAAAIKALGNYRDNKTKRVQILSELIKTVSKDEPSVGNRYKNDDGSGPYATARTKTGDETKARYAALSGPMVEACNKLTDQRCGTAEDWFSLWDKFKGNPGDLFPSIK